MIFQRGRFYTHKNMQDVDLFVKSATKSNLAVPSCICLSVVWVTKKGLVLDSDEISVKEADIGDWREVSYAG